MEVCFKIGIILSHKQLVVNVAEVEQRLVAAEAIWVGLSVGLVTDCTGPVGWLFLVSNSVLGLVVGSLSGLFIVFSDHGSYFFFQILNIMMELTSDDLANSNVINLICVFYSILNPKIQFPSLPIPPSSPLFPSLPPSPSLSHLFTSHNIKSQILHKIITFYAAIERKAIRSIRGWGSTLANRTSLHPIDTPRSWWNFYRRLDIFST